MFQMIKSESFSRVNFLKFQKNVPYENMTKYNKIFCLRKKIPPDNKNFISWTKTLA